MKLRTLLLMTGCLCAPVYSAIANDGAEISAYAQSLSKDYQQILTDRVNEWVLTDTANGLTTGFKGRLDSQIATINAELSQSFDFSLIPASLITSSVRNQAIGNTLADAQGKFNSAADAVDDITDLPTLKNQEQWMYDQSSGILDLSGAGVSSDYDYAHANRNRDLINDLVTTSLDRFTSEFVVGLTGYTGQVGATLKSQSTASSNMNALNDNLDVKREVAKVMTQSQISGQATPEVCNVITGSVVASSIDDQVNLWRRELQRGVLDLDKGVGRASPLTLQSGKLQAHCQNGADASDLTSGLCPEDTPIGVAAGRHLDAGAIISPLTISDMDSASLFLLTAFPSTSMGAIPNDAAKTEGGKETIKERTATLTRNSVASNMVAGVIARKAPLEATIDDGAGSTMSLKGWAQAMSSSVVGAHPSDYDGGVSEDAWKDLNARSWYMNTDRMVLADAATDTNQSLKSIALQKAYRIMQKQDQIEFLDRMTLALATWISEIEDQARTGN